jgi:hypothetical protein
MFRAPSNIVLIAQLSNGTGQGSLIGCERARNCHFVTMPRRRSCIEEAQVLLINYYLGYDRTAAVIHETDFHNHSHVV